MDWENFDFENLKVNDIINEFNPFDPYKKRELEKKFDLVMSKLDLKSNEELTNLLKRLLIAQKEIESFSKNRTHASKRIQFFLEFLSKFIKKIENSLEKYN